MTTKRRQRNLSPEQEAQRRKKLRELWQRLIFGPLGQLAAAREHQAKYPNLYCERRAER